MNRTSCSGLDGCVDCTRVRGRSSPPTSSFVRSTNGSGSRSKRGGFHTNTRKSIRTRKNHNFLVGRLHVRGVLCLIQTCRAEPKRVRTSNRVPRQSIVRVHRIVRVVRGRVSDAQAQAASGRPVREGSGTHLDRSHNKERAPGVAAAADIAGRS